MTFKKKAAGAFFFLMLPLISLFPQLTLACTVCYSGREEGLGAFYFSTAALTILPLAIIGGIGAWIYYQYKKSADR